MTKRGYKTKNHKAKRKAKADERKPEQEGRKVVAEYEMTDAGLLWGDKIISAPFEVLGRARDPNGNDWARVITFKDADGRDHQVTIADADLHTDARALAAKLAGQGLKIAPKYRGALLDYFNDLNVDDRVTMVTRTGWHQVGDRPVFVLPGQSYGQPDDERVLLSGDTRSSPYGSRGTLDDWRNTVGRLSADHRLVALTVSTAFAGVLLHPTHQDGGGVHLRAQSSTGKSSAAAAAASVWGPPSSYLMSWRNTANALEANAALQTDTLMALDEIGVIDARELHAATYQIATGTGKGRAHRDGSARQRATWRVMLVSTGEISMADKVEEDRGRRIKAGQEIRILDIPADAGKGFGVFDSAGPDNDAGKLADSLRVATANSHGTAGPAFIKAMFDRELLPELATLAAEAIEKFSRKIVSDNGQVRRAVHRLGLIAFAGELATELGIVPWPKGAATAAAEFAIRQWIKGRGGTAAAESVQAVRAVRLFIEQFGDSRFERILQAGDGEQFQFDGKAIQRRAGWRKGKGEQQQWLILPEVWRTEVCAGMDPTTVARVLADRDMLDRGGPDELQKLHRIHDKRLRFYTVKSNILSCEDEKTPVTPVTPVTTNEANDLGDDDFEPVTGEKPNENGHVTGVTGVTGEKHQSPQYVDEPNPDDWSFNSESGPTCSQCNADGATVQQNGAWLHAECVRFWPGEPDDLDIPEELRR
jgi:putative DNA primase/helicase